MKAPKKLSYVHVAPIVELSDAQAASITGGGGVLWLDYDYTVAYKTSSSGSLYSGYIYAAPTDPILPGDPVLPTDPVKTSWL